MGLNVRIYKMSEGAVNANNYNSILNENLFNRATKGIYELGSTLKLITAAIAFESKSINENDVFDVSKPLKISSRIINDFHPLDYAINIPEVIVHSSNIGSAKIAEKFGKKVSVGLRLNPNIDAKTNTKISTGRIQDKFGLNGNDIIRILNKFKNSRNIKIKCLSVHIGSQITQNKPYNNVLIAINKNHEIKHSGIKITGV